MALADEDARVVDGLGEAELEDLGLQAALLHKRVAGKREDGDDDEDHCMGSNLSPNTRTRKSSIRRPST